MMLFSIMPQKYEKKNKQIYISGVVMATSMRLTVWFVCIFVPLILTYESFRKDTRDN